jgi:hypothetical protein
MHKTNGFIIDPIALADELAELLKAKNPNGSFVVKKQHQLTIIKAEILLRSLFR